MSISNYRDLKVWQVAMETAEEVYRLVGSFPKGEKYGLVVQLQRAAVSVPSNIAEGHARDSTKEFLHHISVSLGSLAELETQMMLAQRLSYVEKDKLQAFLVGVDELGKMLRGLQKSLKSKLAPSL